MEEILDVVDPENRIIDQQPRHIVHSSGVWHRGIHVLLYNAQNALMLQLRSLNKDKYPGHYDCSVSEHVSAGEDFWDTARRGLQEELNITNVPLTRILQFRMNYGPNDNMISTLYKCHWNAPLQINRHEIQEIYWFSEQQIRTLLRTKSHRFAPWTKEILKWILHLPSRLEPF